MAALKLSLIQKYKLEYSYTYVYSTGFLSPACPEQGARALLLTRREEAPGAYTVLVLSETGIQEIKLGEDFPLTGKMIRYFFHLETTSG